MSDQPQKMYRYEARRYAAMLDEYDNPMGPSRIELVLKTYDITKTTPCGVWVDRHGDKKFVSLRSKKRFACPTEVEALQSFLARKSRHISILTAQIRSAEEAEMLANKRLRELNKTDVDTNELDIA